MRVVVLLGVIVIVPVSGLMENGGGGQWQI